MKKVLILDDRVSRKKTHMSNGSICALNNCEINGYLKMITGEGLENENSFAYCDDYTLLAIHKSWLDTNGLVSDIEKYAKNNQKYLILFSGGIGQTILREEYTILNVNSAIFYTDKLPVFIDRFSTSEVNQPLLQLLYGENWLFPIYMKYRQLLWKLNLESNEDLKLDIEDFEDTYKIYIDQFKDNNFIESINKINAEITNIGAI